MECQPVSNLNFPRRRLLPLWPWLVVVGVLLLVGFIRLRLLDLPLERDEGEYAYAGQLMLQGIPPYEMAYNMKLPGTYAAYAAGMAMFGQTPAGVHATLLVVGSLTIVFVFLLGRYLAGNLAGAIACASYGIMSVSPAVAGLAAHATHFVVLFAVPAVWVLLRSGANKSWSVFAAGFLFGMAFLMKQQGLCFGLFGIFYLCWMAWRNRTLFSLPFAKRILVFGTGLSLPFLTTCIVLTFEGVFGRFWFWTVNYARFYESALTLRQGIYDHLIPHLQRDHDLSGWLWMLTFVGLLAGCFVKSFRSKVFLGLAFWGFSFLGTAAGFYFREHYFILLLPAFALLSGLAVPALQEVFAVKFLSNVVKSLPLIVYGTILSWIIYYQSEPFFLWPTGQVCQYLYRENPFAEAVPAAFDIREHSGPNARIAVIGSEPEIYFYAQRHSATGYIYTYSLMEAQPYALSMQHDMVREFEAARPEYLVYVPYPLSWLQQPGSTNYLGEWFAEYSGKYYEKIGVDGLSGREVTSLWGPSVTNSEALSGLHLTIFQRR